MPISKQSRMAGNFSLRSLLTFLVVGGLATVLQYAIILLTVYLLGWKVTTGSTVGYLISAIVNYLLNARLTFQSTQSHKSTAPRFVVVIGTGLLLTYGMLSLLLYLGAHAVIAQIITTIGVMIWNYVINGIWTFRPKTA